MISPSESTSKVEIVLASKMDFSPSVTAFSVHVCHMHLEMHL